MLQTHAPAAPCRCAGAPVSTEDTSIEQLAAALRRVHSGDALPGGAVVGDSPMRSVAWIARRFYGNDRHAACERVRLLIRTGKLRARLVGRCWMVHVDTIDAFERGADDPSIARHPASRKGV
ncbi:MAG: hypothetical protein GEU83_14360 [Pseudonocardiaceae bacterium]|nr:hypothetical protein [Pseudonocardiaceae bacterium]